jgi:translation initiation factor 1 (eIF-1/SUI1)
MATWGDLVAFVRSEYRCTRVQPDEVRVEVEFEDERRQAVVIYREVFDKKEEWVQIVSPCGKAAEVNLHALLAELGETAVCGGAIVMGEYVAIRHSLPLANLDANEFIDPLALVAGVADELEEKFTGGDGY